MMEQSQTPHNHNEKKPRKLSIQPTETHINSIKLITSNDAAPMFRWKRAMNRFDRSQNSILLLRSHQMVCCYCGSLCSLKLHNKNRKQLKPIKKPLFGMKTTINNNIFRYLPSFFPPQFGIQCRESEQHYYDY